MSKETISNLDVLVEERFQLVNVDPKEGWREVAPLLYPNGTLDKVKKVMCPPTKAQNLHVQSHDGN